ncbi:LexA family protein [Microbulbifer sp. TYP-18]|uniref:LexA family protein n=1 Tax=Microbulbifer sp. TYP-18 TaxID=3230024 RepID=UPI0034C5D205
MLYMYTVIPVPLLAVAVSAGFPSPAAAYSEKPLIIDDWLWPQRVSCQLVPVGTNGRTYLILDQSLRPIVGDQIWFTEADELRSWPCEPLPELGMGIVVSATVRLYRRRADPGPTPESIHDWLVRRPYATYLVRAEGRSMVGHGIHHGSLLVVDRSCDLHDGDIVIAGSADGFLVKQYRANPARLVSGNPEYLDIVLQSAPQYDLDGVVIASLTHHRRQAERRK